MKKKKEKQSQSVTSNRQFYATASTAEFGTLTPITNTAPQTAMSNYLART